jgi:uncharacterized protein YegP (UPF0339 family)
MHFNIYIDGSGTWRWQLVSSNGRVIADSGEGYVNKDDCLHGIGLVMDTNRNTPVYKLAA